ncbi:transposable element Tcb2 transposase [Trichonephila clavipes]|nr:transposable element Tcb2 transposase [Trichonephila clavipes]
MGKDYRPSRRRIFLSHNRSSFAGEQSHSDAILKAVGRRAPNNSKNWQWTTEDDARDHEGRIWVRRYAGERCLPQCVIERHSDLTPGVMQDNARLHVAKSIRDFCSAQHMQLLPRPAYSPDMSHIEHVWDLVCRRLTHDPRPAAAKDELLLRIQAIWNSFPQTDIQNHLTPCHVV